MSSFLIFPLLVNRIHLIKSRRVWLHTKCLQKTERNPTIGNQIIYNDTLPNNKLHYNLRLGAVSHLKPNVHDEGKKIRNSATSWSSFCVLRRPTKRQTHIQERPLIKHGCLIFQPQSTRRHWRSRSWGSGWGERKTIGQLAGHCSALV